jgi:hypothetical protein
MKLPYIIIILVIVAISAGIFLFLYHTHVIVVYPSAHEGLPTIATTTKNIPLCLYINNQWNQQHTIPMDNRSNSARYAQLIGMWLSYAYDQEMLRQQIYVQSVAIGHNTLYVSLSKNPLHHNWSIARKCSIFDGIAKTLYNYNSTLARIYFLENHRIILDTHLDLAQGWPARGNVTDGNGAQKHT